MKNKQTSFIGAAMWPFLIAALNGCSDNSPTQPILREAEVRIVGNFSLSEEKTMVVTNRFGAVVLMGEGREESVSWLLDKSVQAETEQKAREQFDAITLAQQSRNDTLFVSVVAPNNTATITYAADLSLNVPSGMICMIDHALYSFSYDLSGLLTIQKTSYAKVTRHNASCQIDLTEGDIAIEISLSPEGFCRASTKQGHILLSIPATTSAKVEAQTDNGTITYTGLTFTTISLQAAKLTGTLGSGSGEIILKSGQGDIQLKGF